MSEAFGIPATDDGQQHAYLGFVNESHDRMDYYNWIADFYYYARTYTVGTSANLAQADNPTVTNWKFYGDPWIYINR